MTIDRAESSIGLPPGVLWIPVPLLSRDLVIHSGGTDKILCRFFGARRAACRAGSSLIPITTPGPMRRPLECLPFRPSPARRTRGVLASLTPGQPAASRRPRRSCCARSCAARRPWSWLDAAAPRVQQGLTNAARAMEDTLYPPRDKAARRLWDTMNKFKKGGGRKSGRELLLPAESGYLRACAHHFAERLGLQHLSMGEGQARRVLLQLPERPAVRIRARARARRTERPIPMSRPPSASVLPRLRRRRRRTARLEMPRRRRRRRRRASRS